MASTMCFPALRFDEILSKSLRRSEDGLLGVETTFQPPPSAPLPLRAFALKSVPWKLAKQP